MRAPLALFLALVLAPAARADLVYVLNSSDASISVIDTTTRSEVRRIPVLREVHHLILTPDRRELMIGDSVANELVFLNPDTAEVTRREKMSNPYHFAESPDGNYLVVTSLRRDQVDIYDLKTRTLLQRLKVGDMPSHVAYSPDSKMVYVTLQGVKRVAAMPVMPCPRLAFTVASCIAFCLKRCCSAWAQRMCTPATAAPVSVKTLMVSPCNSL